MNLDNEVFGFLTKNQFKLIKALLDAPEGLLSSDLAAKTHVSNKSATLPPAVREMLKEHGLELVIQRGANYGQEALWKLIKLEQEREYIKIFLDENLTIQLSRDKAIELFEELKDSLGL